MNRRDLERIRFTTRNFSELCGLQCRVPVSLILLGSGLNLLGLGHSAIAPLVSMACSAGGTFLMFWAKRYYRRRFGEVEKPATFFSDPNHRVAFFLVTLGVAAFLISRSETFIQGFIQVQYAAIGSSFLFQWLKRGSPLSQSSYYLVLGVALLGLAPLSIPPRFVLAELDRLGLLARVYYSTYPLFGGIACVLIGAAGVVAGLLDHWQLERAMAPRFELAAAPMEERR